MAYGGNVPKNMARVGANLEAWGEELFWQILR